MRRVADDDRGTGHVIACMKDRILSRLVPFARYLTDGPLRGASCTSVSQDPDSPQSFVHFVAVLCWWSAYGPATQSVWTESVSDDTNNVPPAH